MLKSELQKYAEPVLDEDFTTVIVSAVRYALPRHSYMPSLIRDYVWKYWSLFKKHHWCILQDIREHYNDTLNIYEGHLDLMVQDDLNAWVYFYNLLIKRDDTCFPHNTSQNYTPLPLTYENTVS